MLYVVVLIGFVLLYIVLPWHLKNLEFRDKVRELTKEGSLVIYNNLQQISAFALRDGTLLPDDLLYIDTKAGKKYLSRRVFFCEYAQRGDAVVGIIEFLTDLHFSGGKEAISSKYWKEAERLIFEKDPELFVNLPTNPPAEIKERVVFDQGINAWSRLKKELNKSIKERKERGNYASTTIE